MVKWLLQIRGETIWDTLALWINAIFWVPRRWWYKRQYGNKQRAWEVLVTQQPDRHWLQWPITLQRRFYRWEKRIWVDALGLTWLMSRQHEDLPVSWLSRLHQAAIGIDIGAHRGYWSLIQREKMPANSWVILMEPDPENYTFLLRNLALNGASWAFPLPLAGWHSPARLSLRRDNGSAVHGSFGYHIDPEHSGDTLATSVDVLVEAFALPTVDWIKIDVEGAEAAVLEGATETLRRFGPTLWIEMHDTWEAVEALLEEAGYEIKDRIEKGAHGPYQRIGYLWAEPRAGRST